LWIDVQITPPSIVRARPPVSPTYQAVEASADSTSHSRGPVPIAWVSVHVCPKSDVMVTLPYSPTETPCWRSAKRAACDQVPFGTTAWTQFAPPSTVCRNVLPPIAQPSC